MQLLTKELLKQFEKQGDTSEKSIDEITVIAKFFNPMGAGTWYLYEYNPEDRIFMGFANLGDPVMAELGSVSLDELESLKLPFGMGIERDRYFQPMPLRKVVDTVKAGGHI